MNGLCIAAAALNSRLVSYPACQEDIAAHCHDVKDSSDMALLECLQDVGATQADVLTDACNQLVWHFKVQCSLLREQSASQ